MLSAIVVSPNFDAVWPFAADRFHEIWKGQGAVEFKRLPDSGCRCVSEALQNGARIRRLAALNVPFTEDCVKAFPELTEAVITKIDAPVLEKLKSAGVKIYKHVSEGFWGQSVSEYGLALTLCGLRRIPQDHHAIHTNLKPWDYSPPGGDGAGRPGTRGQQFGDDARFTNGTAEGKRVRIVGAGNIASRYASFMSMLGAHVAAWDPYASEPNFHRAGSRREWHLARLVQDAEIFVPMAPLTDGTKGLVTAELINALPKGCLVVLVTRAGICDMQAVRRRVLADELSLAADVFDIEPLPLNDPLLGRHNVVHTPHNAGRTKEANYAWAERLTEQFVPVASS